MKTEVYSWRVSSGLKTTPEREARRRKTPVAALLDQAVRNLLASESKDADEEDEQRRFHAAALLCIGVINSGNPGRSAGARQAVREHLRKKTGRRLTR